MDKLDNAISLLAEAVSKDPELAKELMPGIEESIKVNKEFLDNLQMKKAEDVFRFKVLTASSKIVEGMRKSMVEQIQQAKAERTAEILAIVEDIHNSLHEYWAKVTDPSVYSASKRAIDDYTRELKTLIQEANGDG